MRCFSSIFNCRASEPPSLLTFTFSSDEAEMNLGRNFQPKTPPTAAFNTFVTDKMVIMSQHEGLSTQLCIIVIVFLYKKK